MKKMVVVGAGLVGSLQALYLKRRGHDVTIYEKRSDMRLGSADVGRSINLIVTSRGINALEKISLWNEVKKITTPVYGRMMHSTEGELTYQPYGKKDECNFSISRAELNMLMMNLAEKEGCEIHFEHELVSGNYDENSLIFKTPNGEKSVEGIDHIFGADGGGSKVRTSLLEFLKNKNIDCNESLDILESDYKELFMPSDNGEYPIDKKSLHIWPRRTHMLMALPNQDGSFTMTLYMPKEGDVSFGGVKNESDVENLFNTYYKDSIPLMPNYKDDYLNNPQGFLGTVRCYPWNYKGNVALVGDAAHAIVPFFGQGMNCGFEDVFYLDKFIEEENSMEKAFLKYSEFQKPNGDAIADMALENFIEMRDKVGDKNFLKRKKLEAKIEELKPDYRSRYALVTYTLTPYSEVQKIGEENFKRLDKMLEDGLSPETISPDLIAKYF